MNKITCILLVSSFVACTTESSTVTQTPGTTPEEPQPTETPEGEETASADAGPTTPTGSDAGKRDSGMQIDAGCAAKTFYADSDGDGFGDAAKSQLACTKPAGYVESKTDCNDQSNLAYPGAAEYCDAIDNDCDGTVNTASCTGFTGSYTGTYSLLTEEKVGAAVVNSMQCTGTSALTVDIRRADVITGTMTCAYTGGLALFQRNQPATLVAQVKSDGSVEGTIKHAFESQTGGSRTFAFKGTLGAAGLVVSDRSNSWKPRPQSAVPWTVELSLNASK